MSTKCNLLLVDDDLAGRITLAAVLADAGYEVTEAGSLAEARHALATERLEIALLDVNLPDGRGPDLIGELTRAHPSIAVVILSGADPERISGAHEYIVKGCTIAEVTARVERARAAAAEVVARAAAAPTEREGRVLVVDDDAAVLASLEALLAETFKVTAVSNIADAERCLEATDFDVVLTDYEMPGGTGMEFLRRIAARFPDLMGILVTGHSEHPEVRSAERDQLIVRVITKPYDPARLLRLVGNTVRLSRMKRSVSVLSTRLTKVQR